MTYEVKVETIDNRVRVSLVDSKRKIVSIGTGKTKGKAFEDALDLMEKE